MNMDQPSQRSRTLDAMRWSYAALALILLVVVGLVWSGADPTEALGTVGLLGAAGLGAGGLGVLGFSARHWGAAEPSSARRRLPRQPPGPTPGLGVTICPPTGQGEP